MNTAPLLPVVIPVGWRKSQLRDHLVEPIRNGFSPVCPEYFTGDWVLSLASVGSNGYNPQGAKPAPTSDPRVAMNRLVIGDLLVSRSNTPERVGLAGIYDGDPAPASYPDLLMRVRVGPTINQRLLLELLLSPKGRSYFAATARGSSGSMVKIDRAILEAFPIFAPHAEDEQRAIAEALSDATVLIESLQQLLIKKRQIKQGTMQELLTGKRRLPGFALPWQTYRLDEVTDPFTRLNRDAAELPVITCSKHLGFVDSLAFFRNQVFSNDTSTYKVVLRGQLAYPANHIEEGSIGYQDLYAEALVSPIYVVFQPRTGTNGKFLHRLLKLPQFLPVFGKFTSSSVDRRGSLRWPAFSTIEVVLPAEEEQLEIVHVIEALESEVSALEARLIKARALKQAMAQALLTGRIRLPIDHKEPAA